MLLLHVALGVLVSAVCVVSVVITEPRPFMIVADYDSIVRMNLDLTQYKHVVRGQGHIQALDFDYVTGNLYWADHVSHTIKKRHIDYTNGSGEVFVKGDILTPDHVAVDWLNRRLFWTDRGKRVIERVNLDGTNRTIVVSGNLYQPRGLALDPLNDWFYWTDSGLLVNSRLTTSFHSARTKLERARMSDGSERTAVISTGLQKPNTITIDFEDQKLYFVDAENKTISRCDFNGSNRRIIVRSRGSHPVHHPAGITVFGSRLYWTEYHYRKLMHCNKHDGSDVISIGGFMSPTSIHIYHPMRQPGVGMCLSGWQMFGFHCYKFDWQMPSSYHRAGEMCRLQGQADLVSIETRQEDMFISQHVQENYWEVDHWWTSGSDSRQEGRWFWEGTDEEVYYTNWRTRASQDTTQNYLALTLINGTYGWQDVDNDLKYPFICEMSFSPGYHCNEGTFNFGTSCYEFGQELLTWNNSATYCARNGGHLVYIGSHKENVFLTANYKGLLDSWIGAVGCDGTSWSDGSTITYQTWNRDNTAKTGSCCAQVIRGNQSEFLWKLESCDRTSHFICEYQAGQKCVGNEGRGPCSCQCRNNQCICPNGFHLMSDRQTCQDDNECAINNGGCSHLCNNSLGGYQCVCIGGYKLDVDNTTCYDTDECHNNNGGCGFKCVNTPYSYYCGCQSGYVLGSDDKMCHDDDECLRSPCPYRCHNMPGTYRCLCQRGFTYNSYNNTCDDDNDCLRGHVTCRQGCINTVGSYQCSCLNGFKLMSDGVSCQDVDECLSDPCNQTCTNLHGSYVCSCYTGYHPTSDLGCGPISCPTPHYIDGFVVHCDVTRDVGDSCQLSCPSGELVGLNSIHCLHTGEWSTHAAECRNSSNTSLLSIQLSSNVIDENSPNGTLIGWLKTHGRDSLQMFEYTLDNMADTFAIHRDGYGAYLVSTGYNYI